MSLLKRQLFRLASAIWCSVLGGFPAVGNSADTLTLSQSLELAEERNAALVAAREQVRAAEAAIAEAEAGRYPHADLSAGTFRWESPPALFLGPLRAQLGREDNRFVNLGATQSLYAGGRISASIVGARHGLRIAEQTAAALHARVVFQVKTLFYRALLAQALVSVREDAVGLAEAQLSDAQQKLRAGTAAEFDVLRAQVQVANLRPLLIAARNELDLANAALKRLIGLPVDAPIAPHGQLTIEPFTIPADPFIEASVCRGELRAAEAELGVASAHEEIARAGKYPTVSLFANYFGTLPEYFLAQDDALRWNWIAGINLSFTLFNGFETGARIAQSRARRGEAQARFEDTRAQVQLEVREAVLRIEEARALVDAVGPSVAQAERALEIARLRYAKGAGIQIEVLDSQLALTQARVNGLTAAYQYQAAAAQLSQAIGCPPRGPP